MQFSPVIRDSKTLKNVKNRCRNFERKINASKRWIQRVIKEGKKRKSWSTQFSNHAHILPRITNLPLRTFSNYPRSKTFESHFSHISPVKIRRKRRNRDYSLGKTNVEARSNEWAKGSKGIRIILLERQGSNPLSVHRASLPFLPFRGRGKKLNGAVP